jgi:hypothetical protein
MLSLTQPETPACQMHDIITSTQYQLDRWGWVTFGFFLVFRIEVPPDVSLNATISLPYIVAIGFPQLNTVAGGIGITHA